MKNFPSRKTHRSGAALPDARMGSYMPLTSPLPTAQDHAISRLQVYLPLNAHSPLEVPLLASLGQQEKNPPKLVQPLSLDLFLTVLYFLAGGGAVFLSLWLQHRQELILMTILIQEEEILHQWCFLCALETCSGLLLTRLQLPLSYGPDCLFTKPPGNVRSCPAYAMLPYLWLQPLPPTGLKPVP